MHVQTFSDQPRDKLVGHQIYPNLVQIQTTQMKKGTKKDAIKSIDDLSRKITFIFHEKVVYNLDYFPEKKNHTLNFEAKEETPLPKDSNDEDNDEED